MPMYIKQDIYRIVEYRNNMVWKTRKVGFHWFECGKSPECYILIEPELIAQNGFPAGNYIYVSTLDTVIDCRIPKGGKY